MIKLLCDRIINSFRTPTLNDGYTFANDNLAAGIYTFDQLAVLSDGTFDVTEFDRGIRMFLRDYKETNIKLSIINGDPIRLLNTKTYNLSHVTGIDRLLFVTCFLHKDTTYDIIQIEE